MHHKNLIDSYVKYLDGYLEVEPCNFNLEETEISQSIFCHIFKLKNALWKQSVSFNRERRSPISEIFQDIIATYIKLILEKDFDVVLEHRVGKYQPDILIKYNGENLFIIEVKTTAGWSRKTFKEDCCQRIKKLSETFKVKQENIVYIFQSPSNINSEFKKRYLNPITNLAQDLPTEFPFNQIRPLMRGDDPYYQKWDFNKRKEFHKENYDNNYIENLAKSKIVIPLELTIKEIIAASEKTING